MNIKEYRQLDSQPADLKILRISTRALVLLACVCFSANAMAVKHENKPAKTSAKLKQTTETPKQELVVESEAPSPAKELIQQKKYGEAEKILTSDLTKFSNFVELSKLYYHTAQWDKFFGFARFYRQTALLENFEPDLLVLEISALAKHCQFDVAMRLIAGSFNLIQQLKQKDTATPEAEVAQIRKVWMEKNNNQESKATAELIQFEERLQALFELTDLQQKLPGKVRTTEKSSRLRIFSQEMGWKLTNEIRSKITIESIKSPESLRIYVKDECKKIEEKKQ